MLFSKNKLGGQNHVRTLFQKIIVNNAQFWLGLVNNGRTAC